ncbi:hypothetical protein N0A02_31850 [Paraburkholderia acidicola]|uniref:Uncharacterized protein n=1 Tax=Paraburkholderia acidicola TaxID=1912599 RepID=A0ABV1LXX3_9BURK
MKLLDDGNLREGIRISLITVGVTLVVGSVSVGLDSLALKIVFIAGVAIAAIGGYASQAHMLRIKPFDNSYKKARASYKSEEDKQDGPK